MITLRIYDLRDGRVLALDLRDLIDLLAPRSLEASWTVSPVRVEYPSLGRSFDQFEMLGPGRAGEDPLEILAAGGVAVTGMILSKYAHETHQVIWGQFVATLPEQIDAWVTIRAIDSTFYEVTTSDEEVLAKIRSAYQDVRNASGPVSSAPFPQVPRESGEPHVARNIRRAEITGTLANILVRQPLEPSADVIHKRAWTRKIRDILNREWDPIGGCPEDEYETYAAKVAAMFLQDASDDAIMQYLEWAAVENMGLAQFNSDRARKAIAAIRRLVPGD